MPAANQWAVSTLIREVLADPDLAHDDVFRRLLQAGLQDLVDAEAAAVIGAQRYERTPQRTNRRNGTRPKTVATTAGEVELAIPKLRTGSFFPSLPRPASPATSPPGLGSARTRARGRPGLDHLRPHQQGGRHGPVPARHRHFKGRPPFRIARMPIDAQPDPTVFATTPPPRAPGQDPAAATPSSASIGRSSAAPMWSGSSSTATPHAP